MIWNVSKLSQNGQIYMFFVIFVHEMTSNLQKTCKEDVHLGFACQGITEGFIKNSNQIFAHPSRENECHKRKNECHKIRF